MRKKGIFGGEGIDFGRMNGYIGGEREEAAVLLEAKKANDLPMFNIFASLTEIR